MPVMMLVVGLAVGMIAQLVTSRRDPGLALYHVALGLRPANAT